MHMSEKFEKWWKEENSASPLTSPPEVFDGGWSVGFDEASAIASAREKLILEALRPDLPEDFDLDKVIVDTLIKVME